MRVSQYSRASLVCFALLVLVACSGQTQLIVSVDTDYAVPAGIDEIQIEVTGPSMVTREARQTLSGTDELPHTLTIVPAGESLGPVEVRATGLSSGATVAVQEARVMLEAGRTLTIRLFLAQECAGVTCGAGTTCRCGECEDTTLEPGEWTGSAVGGDPCSDPVMDAGAPDADVPGDDGGEPPMDAGNEDCTSDDMCDDGFACTSDACEMGTCQNTPVDASCSDGTGGMCVAGFGCQYDGCSPSTCVAGPCETSRCDGDTCILEPACDSDTEQCCGGTCVAIGCEDGNPCTDDACGESGCENTNNTAACDDTVFCNGGDTCGGGTCSAHAGDPCSGASICNETMGSCVGCATNADCPGDITGPWGSCTYGSGCAESGSRTRTITAYTCVSGTCQPSASTDNGTCSRSTSGNSCGSTTFSGWGSCGGFGGTCGQTGTRTRTRTERVCSSGSCSDSNSADPGTCGRSTDGDSCGSASYGTWGSCSGFVGMCGEDGTRTRSEMTFTCGGGSCVTSTGTDTGSCNRSTDGDSCGSRTYGTWGDCGGFVGPCGEDGTRSRSQSDQECSGGSCATVPAGTDSESCNRSTNGDSCDTTDYGVWSACGGFVGICGEDGTQTRTETVYECSGGSCVGTDGTDTGSCNRSTEGNNCDSFITCQLGSCSGGACDLTGLGCPRRECCEPGICGFGGACP